MPSVKNVKLKIRGVKAWLDAIDFRDNRLWSMVGDKLVTCVNGEWMDQKEFDEKYPVPVRVSFYHTTENPDKTRLYLL